MADETKPKKKSRKGLWIFLGVVVVFIIIVITNTGNDSSEKKEVETNNNSATESIGTENLNMNENNTNSETTNPPAEVPEETIISRQEIVDTFSEFNWSTGDPVDGKANYLGRSPNELSMIQLIGPEDSLTEISISNTMGPDNVDQMDILDQYLSELKELLTPNLNPEFPDITLTTDTTTSDGFQIVYQYVSFGSLAPGVYTEAYTFKLIQ